MPIEPTQKQLGYAWNGCVAVTEEDVDKTISVLPTEKQVGYHDGDEAFSADTLARLRAEHAGNPDFEIDWVVTKDDIGMQYQRRVFTHDVLDKLRAQTRTIPTSKSTGSSRRTTSAWKSSRAARRSLPASTSP